MSEVQKTISPIDGRVYAERPLSTQIGVVLDKARAAQQNWKKVPLAERKAICGRALSYFIDHADEIGLELTWQVGRPVRYTPNEVRGGLADQACYMIDIADEALADIRPQHVEGFQRYIKREALGVVFVVAPWNYPYLTS